MTYAGDISPKEAMERLEASPNSVLLDVRTIPEWNYVGIPAIERLVTIEWQTFPTGAVNQDFVQQVESAGIGKKDEILILCRSGVRSIAAAEVLTSAGFEAAFNILEGFEGDKDANGQRGKLGGWRYHELPWKQG